MFHVKISIEFAPIIFLGNKMQNEIAKYIPSLIENSFKYIKAKG